MNAKVSPVSGVREFNRFYTETIGVLDYATVLDTPYSLTEARVIFELARRGSTQVLQLRGELGLDAGYLSRILSRLERDGLVTRDRAAGDARRQVAELTEPGREAAALLDRRTTRQIDALLTGLGSRERHRLLASMSTIRGLLDDRPPAGAGIVLREPEPGDLGWIVQRNAEVYAAEYGFNAEYEALVLRIVADFTAHDPERERAWIAEVDGRNAGCVMCVRLDEQTAKLRLLLVDPWARGMGIGGRLVEECLRFARRSGYRRMTLWTNDILASARRIYQRAGFELTESEPHHSFGHDLTGQTWVVAL